jgi:hypothetical protein
LVTQGETHRIDQSQVVQRTSFVELSLTPMGREVPQHRRTLDRLHGLRPHQTRFQGAPSHLHGASSSRVHSRVQKDLT